MTKLEDRVTKLEREMAEARRNGFETRTLASGAHEDTGTLGAKMDAHKESLNVLRETQVEQGKEITSLRKEVATLTTDVGSLTTEVRQGFRDVERRFTFVELTGTNLSSEVSSLQRHVRGLDTEMRDGFAEMRAGFAKMTELISPKENEAD